MRVLGWLTAFCWVAACARYDGVGESVEWLADPWAAVSKTPSGPLAYLSNGLLGVRLEHSGFAESEASKAFLFYKDALIRVPNPLGLRLKVNGAILDPRRGQSYESRLDFRTGVLSVSWAQHVDGKVCRVLVKSVVDPESPVIAQRLDVVSTSRIAIEVWAGVRGSRVGPMDDSGQFEATAPCWFLSKGEAFAIGEVPIVSYRNRYVARGLAEDPWRMGVDGFFARTQVSEFTLERVVGVQLGEDVPTLPSFDEVEQRAGAWWVDRWKTDIEIDGPVEDQQAVRSFLFYMYASANFKMPPMGLSSEKYKGHRFWDAEAWMLPVYALIEPRVSEGATRWRLEARNYGGKIPWEAGCGGIDVTPPEFAEAIHVVGWVSWWLDRAVILGLVSTEDTDKLQRAIMSYLTARAVEKDGKKEILGVMSPDEGRLRDNDLVTNLLCYYAVQSVRRTYGLSLRWEPKIPLAADGLPSTYDRDHLVKYQQTAALLAVYPLEHFDEKTQEALFDRYKDKISDAGPAMSDSVHATIAARLGRAQEAYKLWREAWRPFVRPGLMLFCERRGTEDAYFLTGAAGCLQSVIYGFLGCRIERVPAVWKGNVPAASKPLGKGYVFAVRPNLPSEWRSITFKNVRLPTGTVTIRASHFEAEIIEK